MSDLAFPWVTLQRSARAHRLAVLGLSATVLSALMASVAAFMAPTAGRGAAAAGAIFVLLGVIMALRMRSGPAWQVRVTPEAEILTRRESGAEPRPMHVLFVAPWLVVLADGRAALPVWPDALRQAEYRRLTVASRWRRQSEQT